MKQDMNGVRTAQDLERKYDLAGIEKLKQDYNSQNQEIKEVNNELKDFVSSVTETIQELQDQVDGNITTWFYSGVPTLQNEPASSWSNDEEKNNHLGDLYYDKETGYAYRFSLENSTYSWLKLTDSDVTEALAIANSAKDTADSKRRVFLEQPAPPYENGDMWIKNNEIYICQISKGQGEIFAESDFINNLKYTDDTVANQVGQNLTVLSGSVLKIKNDVDEHTTLITKTQTAVNEQGEEIGILGQQYTEVQQTTSGIQSTVSSIQNDIDSNYYSIQKVNELIQNAETGLTNTFLKSGGSNLLRNTAPFFMSSENEAEYWNGNVKQMKEVNSASGFALLIQNGTLSQTIDLSPNTYAIKFKYKRLLLAAIASVKFNGRTIELDEEGTIETNEQVNSGKFEFRIDCDYDDGYEIYDLMINIGEVSIPWTQNANESTSDTVNISKGITVDSNTTNTKAKMDSDGFRVTNKSTGESVMEGTDEGGKFKKVEAEKGTIGGVIIQNVGNQSWISGV